MPVRRPLRLPGVPNDSVAARRVSGTFCAFPIRCIVALLRLRVYDGTARKPDKRLLKIVITVFEYYV